MADNLPPRPKRIPPHILRRRRIVAVIILLVVLGLIGWGVWALVNAIFDDDDTQTPEPTVTESVEPSPSASEDDPVEENANACDPDVLALTGATDQESYDDGEFPTLSMTITHEGDELCDASVGSDQQQFVVEDAEGGFVFSTRACQVDPQSQVIEMEPGQSESVQFEWERVGTDEQCQEVVEDIDAGQYQLTVGLGEQTAEPVSFELQ